MLDVVGIETHGLKRGAIDRPATDHGVDDKFVDVDVFLLFSIFFFTRRARVDIFTCVNKELGKLLEVVGGYLKRRQKLVGDIAGLDNIQFERLDDHTIDVPPTAAKGVIIVGLHKIQSTFDVATVIFSRRIHH